MRAKKVNETLGFKQGGDPYKKLGVGKYADPEYEKKEQRKKYDLEEIEDLKRKISSMKSYHGGDNNPYGSGSVTSARMYWKDRIKTLQDKYKSKEDLEKEAAKKYTARKKRWDRERKNSVIKNKFKKAKLGTLTPKQIAINKLIDLQRSKTEFNKRFKRSRFSNNSPSIPTDRDRSFFKKLQSDIDNLKTQYNLKSSDLRRQTEYDSRYDDINEFERTKNPYRTLNIGHAPVIVEEQIYGDGRFNDKLPISREDIEEIYNIEVTQDINFNDIFTLKGKRTDIEDFVEDYDMTWCYRGEDY